MKLLIVGGVAGGASAAARARRIDESAEIIMFERGPDVSFANCGLPYHIGRSSHSETIAGHHRRKNFGSVFNLMFARNTMCSRLIAPQKRVRVRNLQTGAEYDESL